jgi:phosphate transport system substrate-binding protein
MRLFVVLLIFFHSQSSARDYIHIVGSATCFPYIASLAELFARQNKTRTPVIETIGTGGGIKSFCLGNDMQTPDIVMSSRKMHSSERNFCKKNGVEEIVEILFGYDALIIGQSREHQPFSLSIDDLAQAMRKNHLVDEKLVKNKMKKWREVNPILPDFPIKLYGPPVTSGTYEAFVDLVVKPNCPPSNICQMRSDGRYVNSGENDLLIYHKIKNSPGALGIFRMLFLKENRHLIRGVPINGFAPILKNIRAHNYPLMRPLFLYVKSNHLKSLPLIEVFLRTLKDQQALGKKSIMVQKGLISPVH